MNITITGRKTTIRENFRTRAKKKLEKFNRFFDGGEDAADAHVTVTAEGGRERVEVTILHRGNTYRAEKTADDRLDALDAALDALLRLIIKNKDKLAKRFRQSAFEQAEPAEAAEAAETEPADDFEIVRTKRIAMRPMTPEEAVLEMNMVGHEFYMFLNAHTGLTGVVYRREAGGYGLIEPVAQ